MIFGNVYRYMVKVTKYILYLCSVLDFGLSSESRWRAENSRQNHFSESNNVIKK